MFDNHIAQLAILLFYIYLIVKFLERSLEDSVNLHIIAKIKNKANQFIQASIY